jgi:transcriptional regulator with XRE-family HTH domain
MSGDPLSLGARIRGARERRHLTQPQLAKAVGVSVRAVGDWENNRTRPKNRLGALEAFLGVNLTEPEGGEVYTDRTELAIWELPEDELTEDEKRDLIAELRRRRHDRRRHDRRAG